MKLLGFLFDLFGRARRRGFWLFVTGLAGARYAYLWASLHDTRSRDDLQRSSVACVHNEVAFIALALVQIATLAMLVRRLHRPQQIGPVAFGRLWCRSSARPWMIWELGFQLVR